MCVSFRVKRGRSSGNVYSTIENALGGERLVSTKGTRRTWSSIAMNNKNFPDGKQLGYAVFFIYLFVLARMAFEWPALEDKS